jgi:mannose-6-phosphate isomerase-like protein (cupin superfamily)
MDPFVVGLPGNNSQRSAMAHEGEEFLYVLEGRVDFEYDGEIHHLEVGDTAYFDATHKHRVIHPDAEIEAQVICVFSKAWVRIGVTTLPCTSASR